MVRIFSVGFILFGLIIGLSLSKAFALSPTEIDMLMSMSPEKQQQLINMARQKGMSLRSATPPSQIKKTREETKNQAPKIEQEKLSAKDLIPKLQPGDSIIVSFEEKTEKSKHPIKKAVVYTPEQPRNLYTLDREGYIFIPGIGRIELQNLTEEQAAARINIEPLLQDYDISVLRLPYQDKKVEELKPYGYDIFRQNPEDFQPPTFIPVPDNYVVGPGDQIHIQLVGKDNAEYLLEVTRDSTLSIPGIGNVPVSGLTFDELKKDLKKRVKRQLIGVEAFVTLGELRSIQVFILGEVEKPGSYSVNALATITNALMYSQGIRELGSFRNIALKRKGKIVGKLDLYDLLNKGDTSQDLRLRPGDVIHVPAKKKAVVVTGEVARPAIYEIKKENKLKQILALAGGLLPRADRQRVQIERVINGRNKLIDIDFTSKFGRSFDIKNGDIIHVNSVLARQVNIVYVKGEVETPGKFAWRPGLRIADVINDLRMLKPNADPEYVVIKRYDPKGYNVSVVSTSLRSAILQPKGKDNIRLMALDEINVLSLDANRTLQLKPILDQLQIQTKAGKPAPIVKVEGQVKGPGRYPLEIGMRVSDLVRASGNLLESAYTLTAELTRFNASGSEPRNIKHIPINLQAALAGDEEANVVLQAHDLLNIKEIPLWQDDEIVELFGEVQFPGRYAIRRGESLYQLLQRAGGLTQYAYPQGAVFIREDLRKREQERLDTMAKNLEAELAAISLQRSGDPTQIADISSANSLLTQLKSTEAAGRLVIDLEKIATGEFKDRPIILRDGDQLFVPSLMQEVSVIGQVYHPTSHLQRDDFGVDDYIELSGGATQRADKDNIYVIRANGGVQSVSRGWNDEELEIFPGDTIVVPLDAERISNLKLWSSISQIVYQLGLSAAAWNTVGIFK